MKNLGTTVCMVISLLVANGIARGETNQGKSVKGLGEIQIHSGAYLLNPYTIDPTTRLLDASAESDASAYLQLDFQDVWAFSGEADLADVNTNGYRFMVPFFWPGQELRLPDLEFRIGYVFQSSEKPSASTIIGSGEFLAEATVGSPFFIRITTNSVGDITSARSLNVELSYGVVTDRATFDVHHRLFSGVAYRRGFESGAQLTFRVGAAWIETVSFVNGTTREVVFERDVPKYSLESTLGVEAEAKIPLFDGPMHAVLGTRIYGGTNPNMWTAYLGATVAVEDLGNLFTPLFGGAKKE